jgi:hypothetical protein
MEYFTLSLRHQHYELNLNVRFEIIYKIEAKQIKIKMQAR